MKKTITLLLFVIFCTFGSINAQRTQSTQVDQLLTRLELLGNKSGDINDYFSQEEQATLRSYFANRRGLVTKKNYVRTDFKPTSFTSATINGVDVLNGPAGTATEKVRPNQTRVPVTITHSATQTIEAGAEIACASGTSYRNNSMYRDFDLAGDFAIAGDFNVTDAEVAIGVGVITPAGFPITVNIYSTTTGTFPGGALTLQGTGTGTVMAADAETIISIPVSATIPAGESMIYEVMIVDDGTDTNYMRFGCNNDGQTGITYIMAADCGAATPTNLADLGLAQGIVMNIIGEEATSGGGGTSAYCSMNATNEFGSFDPADGSVVTVIGASPVVGFENAGAIDPNDVATAYVLDNGGDFYSVDVATGAYTALGNIPGGWLGAEFDSTSGTLYAVADDTNLYSIDIAGVSATMIGSTGLGLAIGLAIDGDGNAYTYEMSDDSLYGVDLATGAATLIGAIGFDANFGQGMFWDEASDTVYMTAFNNGLFDSELRSVDTATGATTLINQMDAGALTQYAWSSSPAVPFVPYVCGGSSAVYDATGLPFDIDGADSTTADCAAAPNLVPDNVATMGTVNIDSAINSVTIDVTHTWSGDLDISLVSPAGTELLLTSNLAGSADNAYNNTIFQDGGADIAAATAPFNAEPFAPMGGTFAETFAGEAMNGDWMLKICDTANGDSGQVIAFSIDVCEPSCEMPTALTADAITETTADLGWTVGTDGETMWDVEWGLVGFVVETGAEEGMVMGTMDNPYTATALTAGTDYEFYVRAGCSATSHSDWAGPFAFTTMMSAFDCGGMVSENFDAGLPAGWSTVVNTGTCDWVNTAATPTGDDFLTPGMVFDDDACGNGADASNVSLLSDVYDVYTNATFATLTYDVSFQVSGVQTFTVEVYDGAAWQQVAFYDADLDPDTQTEVIDVLAYANPDFQVRYTYDDNGGEWGWHAGVDSFCLDYDGSAGIADNSIKGFNFYPNPANDVINLEALNNINSVAIYNVIGQKVISQSFNTNQVALNISSLDAGVYVMKVNATDEVASYQIIKK